MAWRVHVWVEQAGERATRMGGRVGGEYWLFPPVSR